MKKRYNIKPKKEVVSLTRPSIKMKTLLLLKIVFFIAGILFVIFLIKNAAFTKKVQTVKKQIMSVNPKAILYPSPISTTKVTVYLVSLGDKGKKGTLIGCDDSLVPVVRELEPEKTELRTALTALFSEKEQFDTETGYYNSLYKSTLEVDKINRFSGNVQVYLKGTFSMGGECDSPRFAEQIKKTILQYTGTDQLEIYINGYKLENIVSGK